MADFEGPVIDLGPSLGGETKSLYELSETRGAFHGNRRSVIQQNMIARDQMSVGCGSYLERSYTSGARYGSDPTIPGGIRICFQRRYSRLTTCKDNLVLERIFEDSSTSEVDDLHDSVLVDDDIV